MLFLCCIAGGAFKTMPISPKDVKSLTGCVSSESDTESDVKPTPPIVFTFNAPLSMAGK